MSKTETVNNFEDQARQQIYELPFRDPVIDSPVDKPGLDRNWQAVTEAARRTITSNPDVRRAIEPFMAKPLSEKMPGEALDVISAYDERVRRLAARPLLRKYVSLPEVPPHLYTRDVTNSPVLLRPARLESTLGHAIRMESPEYFAEQLGRYAEQLADNAGSSEAEKRLTLERFHYARDVKMLALSAELIDHPPTLESRGDTLHGDLPSGAHVAVDSTALSQTPELLHPETWRGRWQMKDRVHFVTIGDKSYILKERKTDRHRDVKEKGHRDGLTSAEEYDTAREFHAASPVYRNNVKFSWEKPVGYVEFPDGFQFCLFEADEKVAAHDTLGYAAGEFATRRILASRGQYQQEYDLIRERAAELYSSRTDLLSYRPPDKVRDSANDLAAVPLSFEEYASLKSEATIHASRIQLSQELFARGYSNSDLDGYAIIPSADPRALIEIIGFDFEYYTQDPSYVSGRKASHQHALTSGDLANSMRNGVYSDIPERQQMREAAMLALAESAGYPLL